MQTMGISRFKSHALKILDQVAKTQEIIVITKRGKPLAQLIPYKNLILNHKPGKLANAFVFEMMLFRHLMRRCGTHANEVHA